MGRRKIDIAYITDDRVRKVTFCKRKGGLFKKAEDLSKLCGVEIAVVIVGDKKTSEFASTDIDRILTRYKELQSGAPTDELSETSRLWAQLESQRRELESLTRELTAERRKVEELRTNSIQNMTARPMEGAAETTVSAGITLPPLQDPMSLQNMCAPPAQMLMSMQPVAQPQTGTALSLPQLQQIVAQGNAADTAEQTLGAPVPVLPKTFGLDGNASDDTAEVDEDLSDIGHDDKEPEAKRLKLDSEVDGADEREQILLKAAAQAIAAAHS